MSSVGFLKGRTVAIADFCMPFILLTISVEPAWSAPVFPALTKASPFPSASIFSPTPIEESFFSLTTQSGASSIVTISAVWNISIFGEPMSSPLAEATARIMSSFPMKPKDTDGVSTAACTAPTSCSTGALSPLIISISIFIMQKSSSVKEYAGGHSAGFTASEAAKVSIQSSALFARASFFAVFPPLTRYPSGSTMPKLAFIGWKFVTVLSET